jgi:uncharacterized membrane protein (UPF0127 family)
MMRFPIDVLYLDRKKRVRKLRRAMGPWRMSFCLLAHSVLELPAGVISQTGTQRGDQLEIDYGPKTESDPINRIADSEREA